MSTYTERLSYTGSPEYDKHFWNAMRGNSDSFDQIITGRSTGTGLYATECTIFCVNAIPKKHRRRGSTLVKFC